MKYETRDNEVAYKGHATVVPVEAWWCSKCGEGILDYAALRANEDAFQALKARVDGILTGAEVKAIRERLGLSQRKAGELLGGGARAFQKYESGETMVSAPMANLLRLLDNDPQRLRELEAKEPDKVA